MTRPPTPDNLMDAYGDRSALELTECDREPIHIPGKIQPHGVLLAFVEPELRPVSVSVNVEALTGRAPEAVLGEPISSLMTPSSYDRLTTVLGSPDLAAYNPIRIELLATGGVRDCDGILHRHHGLTLLELEPRLPGTASPTDFFRSVRTAIRRLQTATDLTTVLTIAAREVRRLTGFDRVKIYRFDKDWNGQVVAEDRSESIPSFLDFHFPASDIPAQSRALYTNNLIRIIPDIGYHPAPLMPDFNPVTGGPIDLSFAVLRSVSPIHVEYMVNMAVYGAMSVSIVREGRLWGMISCHNLLPRFVSYEVRQACELIAQMLTWQISVAEEAEIVRHSVRVRAMQNRMLHELGGEQDLKKWLIRSGEDMLELMRASGFALCGFDGITTFGEVPSNQQILDLAAWLARGESRNVFESDHLSAQNPSAEHYTHVASGVLAVPLGRVSSTLMLWFRPEQAQTVTWGGDPHKPVRIGPHGGRLQTRASFDAWRVEVRGRSKPWQSYEIAAAVEIRDLVVDVILGSADALERANRELSRSNDELESFAYVAAHDLKEPLRHIEAFAGLLKDALSSDAKARLGTMVDGIEASSRRLRALINDLAEYSRVGREARPLTPVPLDDVLAEVLADLKPVLHDSSAVVSCDPLPVVKCDRSQIRQLLQNLISNALKYSDASRAPRITVHAAELAGSASGFAAAGGDRQRHVAISVEDNGIGFDPKYAEQIFEPFQRLHGADEYEGTGIGLAICRKLTQRHGGRIWARSQPGVGSTFTFTLPLPSLDELDHQR